MINWTWKDTFDVMTMILGTECCYTALYLTFRHSIKNHQTVYLNADSKMEVREHVSSFSVFLARIPHQISTFSGFS